MKKLHVAGASRKAVERYREALAHFPYVQPNLLRRAVILTHKHADVDAYSAAYGVAYLLRQLRKGLRVSVVTPEGLSIPAQRVASEYPIRLSENMSLEDVDLAVVVDTGNPQLLADLQEPLAKARCLKIFLDHHPLTSSVRTVADYALLDESATSTCEIVYDLLAAQNISVTKVVAQVLLIGVLADSRHLKISTAHTVQAAADLCSKGASIGSAAETLNSIRDKSERIARLKGAQRVSLHRLGGWVVALTEVGSYQASAARGLVDLGADFAAAVGEDKEEVRCCLRATQQFYEALGVHLGRDIAEGVAGHFGGVGGGHPTAASFTVNADVESASNEILNRVAASTGLEVKLLR
ncbi:MAG: DHH family phosphoesterase [Thaumarchaeota archaeon]|nr:DHH family phosphoesterase [Nitrososphaerota archaeon]MCL5317352.1 DHH family phosphoesterase [Nitrososphaerota archaeon]